MISGTDPLIERRRLERAKLAVHEYRRRMLELYARDEAQDDDGK